jgi:hypothetical protein
MKKNNVGMQRSLLPIKASNVSLTTATAQFNPLLKDKAHFVGSHFNTQLSNISNLFRQVSVPMVSNTTTMSKVYEKVRFIRIMPAPYHRHVQEPNIFHPTTIYIPYQLWSKKLYFPCPASKTRPNEKQDDDHPPW